MWIRLERVLECLLVKPVKLDCFVWTGRSNASRTDEDRLICILEKTRKDESRFASTACDEDCHGGYRKIQSHNVVKLGSRERHGLSTVNIGY